MRIGIIDVVTNSAKSSFWGKMMHGNYAGVMPQAVAVWCEEQGHEVDYRLYAEEKDLKGCVQEYGLAFIVSFTQSAPMAYALSNLLRSKGAVTAVGGPHARAYPEDAEKYFDYVFGTTDKDAVLEVLAECAPHRPTGRRIQSAAPPQELPPLQKRWKFVRTAMKKAPFIKVIPMLSSIGCPYSCAFCSDADVSYHAFEPEAVKEDLQFLLTQRKKPIVGWSDPNFGIKFGDIISTIESAVPPGNMSFVSETSLSVLTEPNVKRMQKNGFKVLLPGIESWFDMGNKSGSGVKKGMDKVLKLADQVNMILRHVPYMQINFLFPLDVDKGPEPFELTSQFARLAPGAFPHYSFLTAYGRSAPQNLAYQKENRVLPVPFHVLDAQMGMNVKPKNYTWPEFYKHLQRLSRQTFSKQAIHHRFGVNHSSWRWLNLLRGKTVQGIGRAERLQRFINRYETEAHFKKFYDGETTKIPPYYLEWIQRDLGALWPWLPQGALEHAPNAYLKDQK